MVSVGFYNFRILLVMPIFASNSCILSTLYGQLHGNYALYCMKGKLILQTFVVVELPSYHRKLWMTFAKMCASLSLNRKA